MKRVDWEHEGTLREYRSRRPIGHYYKAGPKLWIAEEYPAGPGSPKRHECKSRLGAIKVLESVLLARSHADE